MAYVLDTDTCIFLINRKRGYEAILRRLDGLRYGEVLLSAITLAELRYGVAKSRYRGKNDKALDEFILPLEVLPFDEDATKSYGEIRAALEKAGTPIGSMDLMIAAHAASLDMTLVTNNTRKFSRVSGLKVADWTI